MAGKKGMISAKPKPGMRRKIWQSMRIMRRFTIPDLCRTTGAKRNNTKKFIWALAEHGYVAPFGNYVSGRPGIFKPWRLVRDIGPDYPVKCKKCGNPLRKPCVPPETEDK